MAVTVHEAGEHGAAAEVDHGLARGRIDLAAPAREGHPPVADHERVDHRAGGVHRMDPPVGQEHGIARESGTARAARRIR